MATIEEIDEFSVEIINSLGTEDGEEEPKVSAAEVSSPARAQATESGDDSALVVPSSLDVAEDSDDEDDDDLDETILERIAALTEMFPVCVQNATSKFFFGSVSSVKGFYSFSRSFSWIIFSSAAILFAPIIFEVERAQMEEMQKQQQRQILLGPGAAMSGGGLGPAGMGMAPPPPR